ncbi:hypothetical protein, partial [Sphingobium sp.]|uniref:hypothetical protein n=1 Tax=Sphingobium sp. TaxID=1912891 RepID=UPI0025F7B68F
VTGKMLLAHPVLPPNPRPAISDTYQLTFSACSAGTVQLGHEISMRDMGEVSEVPRPHYILRQFPLALANILRQLPARGRGKNFVRG